MQKLYHGTLEGVAKAAPNVGIKPYTVPHGEEELSFSDEEAGTITLTNVYGAYQAFMAYDPSKSERWAIVEVIPALLNLDSCVDLLRSKFRFKGKKLTWQKSLEMVGLCVHRGIIPTRAVSRVWIFNPRSNWMIVRSVLHTVIGPTTSDRKRIDVVNRWLTGEFVLIDEWFGEQRDQFTKEQRDRMSNLWNDRSGLDLFYSR